MFLKNKKRKLMILFNDIDIDENFWDNLDDSDLEEAILEYVRDCDDFSVWVD